VSNYSYENQAKAYLQWKNNTAVASSPGSSHHVSTYATEPVQSWNTMSGLEILDEIKAWQNKLKSFVAYNPEPWHFELGTYFDETEPVSAEEYLKWALEDAD
jgi:hypothetical protein